MTISYISEHFSLVVKFGHWNDVLVKVVQLHSSQTKNYVPEFSTVLDLPFQTVLFPRQHDYAADRLYLSGWEF